MYRNNRIPVHRSVDMGEAVFISGLSRDPSFVYREQQEFARHVPVQRVGNSQEHVQAPGTVDKTVAREVAREIHGGGVVAMPVVGRDQVVDDAHRNTQSKDGTICLFHSCQV